MKYVSCRPRPCWLLRTPHGKFFLRKEAGRYVLVNHAIHAKPFFALEETRELVYSFFSERKVRLLPVPAIR